LKLLFDNGAFITELNSTLPGNLKKALRHAIYRLSQIDVAGCLMKYEAAGPIWTYSKIKKLNV
jgi:hypothetical protein